MYVQYINCSQKVPWKYIRMYVIWYRILSQKWTVLSITQMYLIQGDDHISVYRMKMHLMVAVSTLHPSLKIYIASIAANQL